MLPTLASIPESGSVSSVSSTNRQTSSRRPYTSIVERRGPRPGVVFVSSRGSRHLKPGRVRPSPAPPSQPKHAPSTLPEHGQAADEHPPSAHLESEARADPETIESKLAQHAPSSPSEIPQPTSRPLTPSEESVDLDSFPLPPNHGPKHGGVKKFDSARDSDSRVTYQDQHAEETFQEQQHVKPLKPSIELDGAASPNNHSRQPSINPALVEAISRAIGQQLRLFSMPSPRGTSSPGQPFDDFADQRDSPSRTSSRNRALDRFSRELDKYARLTDAKGKIPNITPTPTSSDTLRTVSALLPYRSELQAAGLAVTSVDQAHQRHQPRHLAPYRMSPGYTTPRKAPRHFNSQVDGNGGGYYGPHHNETELPFARRGEVDEWRYALVDEVPPRAVRPDHRTAHPRRPCMLCFAGEGTATTDGGSPIPEARPRNRLRAGPKPALIWRSASRAMPPMPSTKSSKLGPSNMSRQDIEMDFANGNPRSFHAPPRRDAPPRPMRRPGPDMLPHYEKTTGIRRPSMTVRNAQMRMDRPYMERQPPRGRYAGDMHLHPSLSRQGPGSRRPFRRPERPSRNTRFDERVGLQENALPQRRSTVPKMPLPGGSANTTRPHRYGNSLPEAALQREIPHGIMPMGEAVAEAASDLGKRAEAKRSQDALAEANFGEEVPLPNTSTRAKKPSSVAGGRPEIPRRTSSIQEPLITPDVQSLPRDGEGEFKTEADDEPVTDRDVLKGLHVAAAAACDEEMNIYLRAKTGLEVRRFLSDLETFEALVKGVNRRSASCAKGCGDDEQRARKRRSEMRKLKERVRLSREFGKMMRQEV